MDLSDCVCNQVTYNWINITDDFFEAVKDLSLGELLHDEMFGLFEAMSAIEMMDPKMDAGMHCNRGNKKALSFKQAVELNLLKLDGLSNSELIGIIDTTFACIISWLEGHSLAQTVFTNLYLHKPYMIEDKTLRVFCIFIYKLIDIIKDFIHTAVVFEEEDFQPMQYGYRLNSEVTEQRILAMLREIEDDLQKKYRRLCEEKASVESDEVSALYNRIRFSRSFYQCLATIMQHSKEDKTTMLPDCQRLLTACSETMSLMHVTTKLGIQPSDSTSDHPQIMGFEPLINQRLLPPTFPRYTKIKPRSEALVYFEEMIDRLKTVCKINTHISFHSALDFFLEFSKNGPCILSRSILQVLYFSNCNLVFGTIPFIDVLKEAAKSFICPPALTKSSLSSNTQAKVYIDAFFSHCTRPFSNFIQLCGHNRARQRDKLAHLLEEFVTLQDEAERVDAYLHNISMKCEWQRPHLACFGTWVLYHTLRIMIMYLLAGFELELYSVHEYYYIFWYLYEFLYGWLVSALTRADSFIVGQESVDNGKNNKNRKTKPKKKKTKPYKYRSEIVYYQALQNMCGGYYKALFGFRLDGKITMPHPQFDSERVRYEHRFAPFAGLLTPPPVQYVEFREMTSTMRYPQQPVDSTYLYIAGCKHFHQARSLLETITPKDQEVNDLLKVAKTNFVVLKLLAGGHKKDSKVPPEFEFTFHRHLPVIKLN